MKKIFCFVLVALMALSAASCGKKDDAKKTTTAATTTTKAEILNPLTGISGYDSSKLGTRPVAVMINNIDVAQKVQTGVGKADMVFETLAEGGITRLMAVYSDISKVGQIGSVRSARISYAQLAAGLNAFYVHCGADNKYCGKSYRDSLGVYSLDLGNNASSVSKRIPNGLAYEHTLFAFGDKIASFIKDKDTKIKDYAKNVYKFNDEDKPEVFTGSAKNICVKFSDYYKTHLRFNSESKKYVRGNSSENLLDNVSGEKEMFKNVFVLYTSVHALPDGYHMKSELTSGEGVYFSNGTYKSIKWSKNGEKNPLKFTNTDGSELKLNAGNSYICITDTDNKSATEIEPFPTTAAASTTAKAQ